MVFVHMVYNKVNAKSVEEVVFVNMVDEKVDAKSADSFIII